ncbi:MAG TPA: SigE family RNA polymerase sigma factor [Kineosporiaceae bacterium]|nr:SigE family RNA polymerase sigma factor [Kineosporiaceae bacterium]
MFCHDIRRAAVNRRGEPDVFGDVTTMDLPLGTAWGRSRARTPEGPGGAGQDGDERSASAVPRSADEAVGVLYAAHWYQLVRLATLLTRDASMAEELVQDAYVSLHRRWDSLADPAAAHGYLRTTVINNARSALRHRGVEERYRQPGPPEPAGPEERAVQATEDARVMSALRTLSRRQQEVLVLRYYADLSEQDIASTLGLTRGAVKSHAHRGLAALRAALERGEATRG